MPARSVTAQLRLSSLPAKFENYRKYDKDSKHAKRLNKAVAEVIFHHQVKLDIDEKS